MRLAFENLYDLYTNDGANITIRKRKTNKATTESRIPIVTYGLPKCHVTKKSFSQQTCPSPSEHS